MSAEAIAAILIGCIALVVVMAIAGFIMLSVPMHALRDKRCGRPSMCHGHREYFQTHVAFSRCFTMAVFSFETVSRDKLKRVDLASVI